jgi:HEAT repeat protein
VRVRSRAATYLGKLRVKGAVEPLLVALDDTNGEVRAAAASALGRLGEPRAQAKLAEVVLRSAFRQPGFDEALGAWVHLQGAKAVRVLEECAQPSESNPSMLARSVLEKVKRLQ